MANIKIDSIGSVGSAAGPDKVLTLQDGTNTTLMTSVDQITTYVNNNLAPDGKVYQAGDYYVDLSTGSDTNAGTSWAAPLATVQEALNRVLPSFAGVVELTTDTYIFVRGPGTVSENVVVPAHTGEGCLVIEGDTTVQTTLTVTGTFNPIGASFSLQDITFSSPTLTASDPTIVEKSFLRPQVSSYGNVWETQVDCFPVLDNGTAYVRCPVTYPGLFTGFDYTPGALVDVVTNNVTWAEVASPGFTKSKCFITNLGGNLIVKNFIFEANPAAAAPGSIVLNTNQVGASGSGLFQKTQLTQCIFKDIQLVGNGDFDIVCCIGGGAGTEGSLSVGNSSGAGIWNSLSIPQSPGNWPIFIQYSEAGIFGLYCKGYLQFFGSTVSTILTDVRERATWVLENSYALIYELDISDSVVDGLFVDQKSTAFVVDTLSGTNNAAYGAQVGDCSSILNTSGGGGATLTLTGTLGELKVGNAAVQAWAAGSVTDPVYLARFGVKLF